MTPEAIQLETCRIKAIAPNFSYIELKCPCCGVCHMDLDCLMALQALRNEIGIPLSVNSGFRCAVHNEKVGGKPNSYHLIGKAVDINTTIIPAEKLHTFMRNVYELFRGVGIARTFTHMDIRENLTHWVY